MLSILHIDFNVFYKKIIEDIAEKSGFEYFSADMPEEAFHILDRIKIDVIVTSLEFSHKSGEEFIKSLNLSKHKNIPVIVLTANDDIKTKSKLFHLGVIDYILKDNFTDRLTNYINKFKEEDSSREYLKNLKIAVLDDNELELRIIKKILELNGILNVDYFLHPAELLKMEKEYDIYIIDLILPVISGKQVVLEIRKKYKYSLIIAVSSVENEIAISNLLETGVDDYITKPFSQNIFLARLKANLRIYSLLQKLKKQKMELEEIVKIDGLTNTYTRKYTMDKLDDEIKKSIREKKKLSIIMFDIDHFKLVNDTYGHQFGDEVIKEVSNMATEIFKDIGIVGRYGGEEFIAVIFNTDIEKVLKISENLRYSVQNMKFDKPINVTISCGIAQLNKEDTFELVEKADKCLYNAKKNGRNRIEY